MSTDILNSIWSKTLKTDTCWLWQGSSDKNGYGLFRVSGKTARLPRVVYKLVNNVSLYETQHVLHLCDTPACINPAHLFIGSHAKNMADMAQKGRANKPVGSSNGRARLTELEVSAIKHSLSKGEGQSLLADKYKVSRGAIYHIARGTSWQ